MRLFSPLSPFRGLRLRIGRNGNALATGRALLCALLTVTAVTATSACAAAPRSVKATDPGSPLKLERKIALPDVKGRIDHLALDVEHRRLFVAEYGNGSVDEIDLESGRVVGRISGFNEPQGIAYLAPQREIVVASGDGIVRFFAASDRHQVAALKLGDDADNVRIDPRNGHVVVGYGGGLLAVIDPATHRVLNQLALPGHPEGFWLIGSRALVNIPDRGVIMAGDIDQGRILAPWPTGLRRLNFPLAVEPAGKWFAVAYRMPATLAIIDTTSGKPLSMRGTCGDADDLFLDRGRIYVVCGAGHVEVDSRDPDGASVRVETAGGARTGLFSPDFDKLFVAAPARGGPAAIWVLATAGS